MVCMSKSACVGCCPFPSPAFMTGTRLTAAALFAAPSSKCLSTMQCEYPDTILIVSSSDSPLAAEENCFALAEDMTLPPRFSIADSKLNLVLVLSS